MSKVRPDVPNFSNEEALFWREHHDRVPAVRVAPYSSGGVTPRVATLRERVKSAFVEFLDENRALVNTRELGLIRSSYAAEEFVAALDVMMDDRMTMGAVTAAFEDAWSAAVGVPRSIMVNSGSSANLLALSALASADLDRGLRPGDEVIVPAVAWSTTIFPVVQAGCVPVLVDIDRDTLNIDPAAAEAAIGPNTKAIVVVHLLGNPCDMERIGTLARRHNLWVIEDCCEAHGATIDGRAVGSFGDLATFSFFFSHHMTTIEGGMISFRDAAAWGDALISLRAHGWVRGRSDREQWKAEFPDIDDRWLFVSPGYNLRPTDISAAFGLAQLRKLPEFVRNRQLVRRRLLEALEALGPWLRFQHVLPGHEHSAFGLSMIVEQGAPFTRAELQSCLEEQGIQTRPIIGSNFARQPVMRRLNHRVVGTLTNADLLHFNGLMIGNHHDVTASQVDYVTDVIAGFLGRYR